MKTILVAIDLSSRSDRAFNRALALSDEQGTNLVVLHVIDEELPSSVAETLKLEAESIIESHLAAFPTLKRENISCKVVFGRDFKDILKEAAESEVDLIVLGTHRDSSIHELFVGTTVERIVRRGDDPVLVVKDRMKGPYRRVLIGVDFSVYSRRAVEYALKFVPNGEIFLVHAYEIPFRSLFSGRSPDDEMSKQHQQQMDAMLGEEMAAFLDSLPSPASDFKQIMVEGSTKEVILDQVKKLRPDLLVIGTHGRTGVAHALLGSQAEKILSDPPCDVLAVKAW